MARRERHGPRLLWIQLVVDANNRRAQDKPGEEEMQSDVARVTAA